jgi:hypothetical protein
MMAAGILALLGLAGSAAAWFLEPAAFYRAWLAATVAFAGWPLGSLALLFVHSLTGGAWGRAIRPALLASAATMPLLLLAAVPLAFGMRTLFPWFGTPPTHLASSFYLNAPFFGLRAAIYLVAWFGLAGLAWQRVLPLPLQDGDDFPRLSRLAPIGLIVLALTVTFASIDLTEALDPDFNSSIWGMLTAAEFGLFALAAAILATLLSGSPAQQTLRDLARLLLGLVILWAYLEFVQALIVWESDLPKDIAWYLPRVAGAWGLVAWAIAAGHFAIPFLCLLGRRAQGSPPFVGGIAALLVISSLLRWWWVVLPPAEPGVDYIDIVAMLGLLCPAAAVFLRVIRSTPRSPEPAHG